MFILSVKLTRRDNNATMRQRFSLSFSFLFIYLFIVLSSGELQFKNSNTGNVRYQLTHLSLQWSYNTVGVTDVSMVKITLRYGYLNASMVSQFKDWKSERGNAVLRNQIPTRWTDPKRERYSAPEIELALNISFLAILC